MNGSVSRNHKYYIDVIRIISVFWVIFNHIDGGNLYVQESGSTQWIYLAYTIVSRVSLPLFFMISGSLLLSKDEEIEVILKKRVIKFVVIILVFGVLAYIFEWIQRNIYYSSIQPFEVGEMFSQIISSKISMIYSYWFLYAYVGFLLMLPVLRSFAVRMTNKDFIYLVVLKFIISSILPMYNLFAPSLGLININLSKSFDLPTVTVKIIFYTLIGYYLDNVFEVKSIKKSNGILLAVFFVVTVLLTSICIRFDMKFNENYNQNLVTLFEHYLAICFFVFIKRIVIEKEDLIGRLNKPLSFIGSLTFGMYLMDPFLRYAIYYDWFRMIGVGRIPVFVNSIAWCFFSMVTCGVITYILKKCPIFRKII